ncbi:MAG: dTMP kinase [Solirubrobacterales bacterium]
MFVTFEGIDGAGKSTQARMLAEALGSETLLLREPGGTELGERLRTLLKDPSVSLTARTELLLFAAARAELVARAIKPALAAGRDVVCDRFYDSTVAYQGIARGVGERRVVEVNEVAIDGCRPDRTVLLRVDPRAALERGAGRGDFGVDRFEREGADFQRRIGEAFERIAEREPGRLVAVDATGDPDTVHREVVATLGLER